MAEDPLVAEGKEVDVPEEAIHRAEVTDVSARETEYGTYVDLELSLEGSNFEGLNFGVPFKQEITGRSMIGKLIAEITGEPVQAGKSYPVRDLLEGAELKVEVEHDDEGFPQVKKTEEGSLNIEGA